MSKECGPDAGHDAHEGTGCCISSLALSLVSGPCQAGSLLQSSFLPFGPCLWWGVSNLLTLWCYLSSTNVLGHIHSCLRRDGLQEGHICYRASTSRMVCFRNCSASLINSDYSSPSFNCVYVQQDISILAGRNWDISWLCVNSENSLP